MCAFLTLQTQAQVDAVSCTSVTGRLLIAGTGNNITNIDALGGITSVGGDLVVLDTHVMTNIDGLGGITSVAGTLRILSNDALANLDGLGGITSVGRYVEVSNNSVLDSFCGLFPLLDASGPVSLFTSGNATNPTEAEILAGGSCASAQVCASLTLTTQAEVDAVSCTSVPGQVLIGPGNEITNLEGLRGITSVGGNLTVDSNSALTNLDGLGSITSVGGSLSVSSNAALANLDGLGGITSVGTDLEVLDNAALDRFCGLFPLLDAIGLAGSYTVSGNATNPTEAEILAGGACLPAIVATADFACGFDSETAVILVDPTTGNRTVLSGSADDCETVGSGEPSYGMLAIAAALNSDILVSDMDPDLGGARILQIDSSTGNRSIVSGCTLPDSPCAGVQVGTGPNLRLITQIEVVNAALAAVPGFQGAEGDLLVLAALEACAFPDGQSLLHIDVATGNRTIVSGDNTSCNAIGNGDPFLDVVGLSLAPDGTIWVGDGNGSGAARMMTVDPASGDRIVVSGCNQAVRGGQQPDVCTGSVVGTGPDMGVVYDVVQPNGATGGLFALSANDTCPDGSQDFVLQIDLQTGNRSTYSGFDANCMLVGAGTEIIDGNAMIPTPAGDLLVVEDLGSRLVSVDGVSGQRQPVTGCSDSTFAFPVSCDPPETIIGTGPEPLSFIDAAFVPEPSFGLMLLFGAGGLSGLALRRR